MVDASMLAEAYQRFQCSAQRIQPPGRYQLTTVHWAMLKGLLSQPVRNDKSPYAHITRSRTVALPQGLVTGFEALCQVAPGSPYHHDDGLTDHTQVNCIGYLLLRGGSSVVLDSKESDGYIRIPNRRLIRLYGLVGGCQ